ncbi:histidine kinase [Nocardiopsis sp. ARC36]
MNEVWARALRASGYLLVAFASGLAVLVALPLTLAVVLTVPIGGLGFVLLPPWLGAVGRFAAWHQGRASDLLRVPVPELPGSGTPGFRALWREPSTRRVLLWMPVFTAVSMLAGLLGVAAVSLPVTSAQFPFWWALPEGMEFQFFGIPADGWGSALLLMAAQLVLGIVLLRWAVVPAAKAHARLNLRLLAPTEAELLAARVDELSRTRAEVVDAHGAELRRIERDLHDGTQARLVSIAMQLGVAREALAEDPRLAALLKNAHEGAEEAMTELREVIRGIYPPILADRGLAGALSALVARTTVTTRLDVGDLGTLPVAAETAAYFVVTEAVTNAVRHGAAEEILVRLDRVGGVLRVSVRDDGAGGVDESRGTGVTGIRRRVAALDGTVRVESPAGGPTVVEVELPCGS